MNEESRARSAAWILAFACYAIALEWLYLSGHESTVRFVANAYARIGFEWKSGRQGHLGTQVCAALSAYLLALLLERIFTRRPRFRSHDVSSLKQSLLRMLGYAVLSVLGLGAYGAKSQAPRQTVLDYWFDGLTALIFAGVVVVAADFFEAVVQVTRKGKS